MRKLTGGVLHSKFWVVDGRHIYLGSANMDWRALTQVNPESGEGRPTRSPSTARAPGALARCPVQPWVRHPAAGNQSLGQEVTESHTATALTPGNLI